MFTNIEKEQKGTFTPLGEAFDKEDVKQDIIPDTVKDDQEHDDQEYIQVNDTSNINETIQDITFNVPELREDKSTKLGSYLRGAKYTAMQLPERAVDTFIEGDEGSDYYFGAQAGSLLAQAINFIPEKLYGLRQNVQSLLEWTLGKDKADFVKKASRFNPFGAAAFGDFPELDNYLDSLGRLKKRAQDNLYVNAYEKGGKTGMLVAAAIDGIESTLMNIAFYRMMGVGYGVAGTKTPSRGLVRELSNLPKHMKVVRTIRDAAIRTGINIATSKQTSFSDTLKSAAISMMYQSTPAISGLINNNFIAAMADMIQNVAITKTFTAQSVVETAYQTAADMGRPDLQEMYALIALSQAYSSDIVFGAMTRSFSQHKYIPNDLKLFVENAPKVGKESMPEQTRPSLWSRVKPKAEEVRIRAATFGKEKGEAPAREQTGKYTSEQYAQAPEPQIKKPGFISRTMSKIKTQALRSSVVSSGWGDKGLTEGFLNQHKSGKWTVTTTESGADIKLPFTIMNENGDRVDAYARLTESSKRGRDYDIDNILAIANGLVKQPKTDDEIWDAIKKDTGLSNDDVVKAFGISDPQKPDTLFTGRKIDDSYQRDPAIHGDTPTEPVRASGMLIEDATNRGDEGSIAFARKMSDFETEHRTSGGRISIRQSNDAPLIEETDTGVVINTRAVDSNSGDLLHYTIAGENLYNNINGVMRKRPRDLTPEHKKAVAAVGRILKKAQDTQRTVPMFSKMDFGEYFASKEAFMIGVRDDAMFRSYLKSVQWKQSNLFDSLQSTVKERIFNIKDGDITSDMFDVAFNNDTIQRNAGTINNDPSMLRPIIGKDRIPLEVFKGTQYERTADNISKIYDVMDRSVLTPEQQANIRNTAENVFSVLLDLASDGTERPITTAEQFMELVESVVKGGKARDQKGSIRQSLYKNGLTNEDLNEYAVSLGKERVFTKDKHGEMVDTSRSQLTSDELRTLAESKDIHIPPYAKNANDIVDLLYFSYKFDNPEDTLRAYNEISLIKKRPMITDPRSDARGNDGLKQQEYRITEDERIRARQFMPKNLVATPEGREVIERTLDQINHKLPEDPRAFRDFMRSYAKSAAQTYNFTKKPDESITQEVAGAIRRYWADWGEQFYNIRYKMSHMAGALGDTKFFNSYHLIDKSSMLSKAITQSTAEMVLKESGITKREMAKLQRDGRTLEAVKYLLSYNENVPKDSVFYKKYLEHKSYLDGLKGDDREKAYKLAENIKKYFFDGIDAMSIKRSYLYRFKNKWNANDFGLKYAELDALAGARTPGQEETYQKLTAELNRILPSKSVEGKHQYIDWKEMVKLMNAYIDGGDKALMPLLDKQEGWVRENYYMTQQMKRDSKLKDMDFDLSKIFAGEEFAGDRMELDVYRRTGDDLPKEGDLWGDIITRSERLRMRAESYFAAHYLKQALDNGVKSEAIPRRIGEYADNWLKSQWGNYVPIPRPVSVVSGIGNVFWTTYAFTKGAYYTARNKLLQGTIWGNLNAHFRVVDVQRDFWRNIKLFTDKNSRTRKWYDRKFRQNVMQQNSLYYDMVRNMSIEQFKGMTDSQYSDFKSGLRNITSFIISASDTANRWLDGAAFTIIDRHVERYINGQSTIDKVFDDLKIRNMSVEEQKMYQRLFMEASGTDINSPEWDAFRDTLAEAKIENMNFNYRLSGRSLADQDPAWRPLMGVKTYASGEWDQVVQNGFAQVWRAYQARGNNVDWMFDPSARQGFETVAKWFVGHVIGNAITAAVIGEMVDYSTTRRDEDGNPATAPNYSIGHSLTISPHTPGLSWATELGHHAFSAICNMINFTSNDDVDRNFEWLKEKLWVCTIAPELILRAMEGVNNDSAVSRWRYFFDRMEGLTIEEKRTGYERFLRAFFGTAKHHDPRRDNGALEFAIEALYDGSNIGRVVEAFEKGEIEKYHKEAYKKTMRR